MGKRFLDYMFGGATTPMAGDGSGGVPSARPPELPRSPKSPGPRTADYYIPDQSTISRSSTSGNPSPIQTECAGELVDSVSQYQNLQMTWPRPARSPNGIRAPRCSLVPLPIAQASKHSPRPSMESFHTVAEEEEEASVDAIVPMLSIPRDLSWEDFEIPQELELLREDIPRDIRNIVQESMDEHRAMRSSRMQSQAFAFDAHESSAGLRENDQFAIAQSSATASALSTPVSEASSSNSARISIGSDTSAELSAENSGHLKPPIIADRPVATILQAGLRTKDKPSRIATNMERRFQESKSRTHKSHHLFRLLPHRRSRGEPSPELHGVEAAMVECTGCMDEFASYEAIGLPCRHNYCSPCFSQLVSASIQSEDSYPPKCCLTDIPRKTIRDNLPPLICARFEDKALEYAVPISNRYYCVSSSCGKWIDTRNARKVDGAIECPHCTTKLCTLCRGISHPSNEDCPQDFGLGRALEQADRAGWRRCYNCRTMVELNTGCRHITCRCKAQFCYTCGATWRTCNCTEADQKRRDQLLRTRRVQYEADRRAEEEELRAAAAAVEAAERLLREEREAEERQIEEEAKEMHRQEAERLQGITIYFEYLRGVLERVRLYQRSAIEKRHDREWDAIDEMRDDIDSVARAAEREAHVKLEREQIIASTGSAIKVLQRQQAAAIMETMTRHRKDQDELFASSTESEDQDAAIRQAETIQEMMLAQDLERTTLKTQQAQDIQRLKRDGESSLQAFDSRMLALKMRLEEAENITRREGEVRDIIFADGKWSELLFEERSAMLAEDERKLVRNGGDAPSAPKRDTVVMPGKQPITNDRY